MIRTEVGVANEVRGKWNVSFNTYIGEPGSQRLSGTITTPAKFDSEDDALDAGSRALTVLEQTGIFPNFSEAF